jgi:hypothetical protein
MQEFSQSEIEDCKQFRARNMVALETTYKRFVNVVIYKLLGVLYKVKKKALW